MPALDGSVPFIGYGGALKDGHERVGDAGGDDDEADQVHAGGEGSVACGEDSDVE